MMTDKFEVRVTTNEDGFPQMTLTYRDKQKNVSAAFQELLADPDFQKKRWGFENAGVPGDVTDVLSA